MATTATPHQAWYARAATALKRAALAVKNEILKIAGEAPAVMADLQKAAPTVEGITNLVLGPGATAIETVAMDVFGVVAKAIEDAGSAATNNGLSLSLDAQIVADVQAILPTVKKFLDPGATAAAPAK